MELTTEGVLAFFGPILIAAIGSYFAYRKAVALSKDTNQVEGRKTNLSELEATNAALGKENDRLREDRDEDEARYLVRVQRLEERLGRAEGRNADLEMTVDSLVAWAREVAGILRRPAVAAILADEGVTVPVVPLSDSR